MGIWDNLDNLPPLQENYSEEMQRREKRNEDYEKFCVEPTALADGTMVRSRLEALWIAEFINCDSFYCTECVPVPIWIDSRYGKFKGDYKPDLIIYLSDGSSTFVELKPNHKFAMADDRQKRALEITPEYRFVVIGGYPYSKRGVTVRMLTGKDEAVHRYVQVCDVLKFLECECA